MLAYTLRRLALAVPTLGAISFVIFTILYVSPADPCAAGGELLTAEQRAAICKQLGADVGLLEGYGAWAEQFLLNEALYRLSGGGSA